MERPERIPAHEPIRQGRRRPVPPEQKTASRRRPAGGRSIVMLGPDGTVTWMLPPVGERPGGWERAGHHFSDMFEDEDRETGLPALLLKAAVAFGRSGTEGWQTRSDGSRCWSEVKVICVQNGEGRTEGFVVLVADKLAAPPPAPATADDLADLSDGVASGLAELLFNRVFAVGLTLRRVAGSVAPQVVADRVEAALEEIDAVISDVHGFAFTVPHRRVIVSQ